MTVRKKSKILIFMNEQFRAKKPKHGIVTVQVGDKQLQVNELQVSGTLRVRKAQHGYCKDIKTHNVRVWLEVE